MKNIITKFKITLKNYKPSKPLLFLYFLIPALILLATKISLDNDIWFILNNGKYILEHGIPSQDPFTIHENLRLVMQQWLSSIIFYKIYDLFGYLGLIIFMILMNTLIIFLTYKLCMLVSKNKVYLSTILTIIIDSFLISTFIVTRPQLFDYILLLSELYLLELYIRKKKTKYLIPLPIISLLMINLHATSFLLLFCFILPYIIDSFKINLGPIKKEGYKKSPLIISTILMLLTGLINPYKIDAITYIFTSLGKTYVNDFIIEMQPLNINIMTGKIIFSSIALVLLSYILLKKGKLKLRYLLLTMGTIYLSLSTLKGTSTFYIAGIFPLADYLSPYFKEYKNNIKYTKKFKLQYIFILIILLIATGTIFTKEYKRNVKEPTGLKKSAQILNKISKKEQIKLYTDYENGAYIEFAGLKPYIDPRADVFYKSNNKKEDIMKEYVYLQTSLLDINEFLTKYEFTHLLVDKKDILYKYLKKNKNYNIIYKTKDEKEKYYIFKKAN